jgi:hypothetical protein
MATINDSLPRVQGAKAQVIEIPRTVGETAYRFKAEPIREEILYRFHSKEQSVGYLARKYEVSVQSIEEVIRTERRNLQAAVSELRNRRAA